MKKSIVVLTILSLFNCVCTVAQTQINLPDDITYEFTSDSVEVLGQKFEGKTKVTLSYSEEDFNDYGEVYLNIKLDGDNVESGTVRNIYLKPHRLINRNATSVSFFNGESYIQEDEDGESEIEDESFDYSVADYDWWDYEYFNILFSDLYWSPLKKYVSLGKSGYYKGTDVKNTYRITADVNGVAVNDDALYMVQGRKNAYPVTHLTMEINGSNIKNNCVANYYVNTLPKGFLSNTSVNKVNFGPIKYIETGAFKNAQVEVFVVVDDFRNFKVYNGCLYNYDMTTLIAVPYRKTGIVEIPSSVVKIAEGAMDMVQNVTIKSSNPDIKYSSSDFNSTNNNKVVKPSDNIEYKTGVISTPLEYIVNSSKGITGRYVTPKTATTLSKSMVEKLIANIKSNSELMQGVSYIDLTGCSAPVGAASNFGEISLNGLNKNCLLFLPAGIEANGTNVVVGGECEKLDITRDSSYPFESPYDFNASEAVINGMNVGNNYIGVVFPFDFATNNTVYLNGTTSMDVKTAFKCASFDNYNPAEDKITMKIGTGATANVPFWVKNRKDGATWSVISFEDVKVKATKGNTMATAESNGVYMAGTYFAVTNDDTYTDVNLLGLKNNEIAKAGGATFKPFSSFFVNTNSNTSNVRVRVIDEDGFEEDLNQEATGVQNVEIASVTVNGKSIQVSTEDAMNITVASVSGAVIFNEVVSGTKTIEVESGVYVVNGKKVIIK